MMCSMVARATTIATLLLPQARGPWRCGRGRGNLVRHECSDLADSQVAYEQFDCVVRAATEWDYRSARMPVSEALAMSRCCAPIKQGRVPLGGRTAPIDPERRTCPGSAQPIRRAANTRRKLQKTNSVPVGEAAVGSVRETLKEQGLPAGGNVTFVQARTAHEIAKAHLARLRLQADEGRVGRSGKSDRPGVSSGARGAGFLAQLAGACCCPDRGRPRRGRPRGSEDRRGACPRPPRRTRGSSTRVSLSLIAVRWRARSLARPGGMG